MSAPGDDGYLDIHLPSCYDKGKSFLEAATSTSVVTTRTQHNNEISKHLDNDPQCWCCSEIIKAGKDDLRVTFCSSV